MRLKLIRYNSTEDSTLGLFILNGKFLCFTMERPLDSSAPRIEKGIYRIEKRMEMTPLTERYRQKYKWFDWHLEVKGVPKRTDIYIHVANFASDLLGCIGVGNQPVLGERQQVLNSVRTFEVIYGTLSEILKGGIKLELEIIEEG